MRWRWLIPIVVVGFAGCLLPEYSAAPKETPAAAGSGPSSAGSNALGISGSTSGEAGAPSSVAGTGPVPDGGAPNMPGGCLASQKDCAGECVELDDVMFGCTATSCNQSDCPAGGETYACEAGECVIATCPADSKKCDGRCVSVSDPTFGCGLDSCDDTACPDPGTGTVVCSDGSCIVGNCTGATKKCGSKCVPLDASNGCADATRCTPCESHELCSGEPSECTCEPDDVEACKGKACGPSVNNCGVAIQCPDNCAAPSKCGAGNADENHCGFDVATGNSTGCNKAPTFGDASVFTKRNITVTGVDAGYVSAYPPAPEIAPYTWTARNYFVKLPANYQKGKPYPVVLSGGGCGSTNGMSGMSGGVQTLAPGQDVAIQIGLSYSFGSGQGACFQDDTAQTPEVPYFDAVLADVEANFCVDRGKVFATGYSSGAFESLLFACARAGKVRGIGTAAGGHRLDRPACAEAPVAAMMIVGEDDAANPIAGEKGSGAARDDILQRNGCTSSQSVPWHALYPQCDQYVDCPAAYPVVWCALAGGHTSGGTYSSEGIWTFFQNLPTAP